MQGVPEEGDFRFYQGVWRMQELPACEPAGSSAMRLTYSVELSPRAWVPVALLEGDARHNRIRDEQAKPSRCKVPASKPHTLTFQSLAANRPNRDDAR